MFKFPGEGLILDEEGFLALAPLGVEGLEDCGNKLWSVEGSKCLFGKG